MYPDAPATRIFKSLTSAFQPCCGRQTLIYNQCPRALNMLRLKLLGCLQAIALAALDLLHRQIDSPLFLTTHICLLDFPLSLVREHCCIYS